ncbi:SDR family NAD(P)-dependent oxidoreductase [Cryobacterium sp. Y50]|uniref:SDR family NAD(P)-dependent oxidoreductase n=1 Tax=Cryobacterium sp. Y50 TaxID=2048286 RepID=UPI000CE3BC2A|nr:SDR family oxidoreductase [Cryobacterium sp. Y50]
MELDGLKALVTGGSSGIGAAVVRRLIKLGAEVAILDIAPQDAEPGILALHCDVTDDVSVRTAVEAAAERLGGVDIVVNNAGIGAQGTIEDNDDSDWHRVFDLNVLGVVRVSRHALPHLRRSMGASIVNMCSVVAHIGLPQRALYSATKGAVFSLTLSMAADYLIEGIRVNCVSPGTADTPWVGRLISVAPDPAAERVALELRQPHGRLVSPEEIAAAVVLLSGPLSGSTTGTNFTIDGGLTGLRI